MLHNRRHINVLGHIFVLIGILKMDPVGFEPTIARVETECIIQLCYGSRKIACIKQLSNYCKAKISLAQANSLVLQFCAQLHQWQLALRLTHLALTLGKSARRVKNHLGVFDDNYSITLF